MRKILFGLMAALVLGAGVYAFAGNLDSPSAPGTQADKMYTVEEVYQYIENSTTPGARTAVFDEPTAGPAQISGTTDSATSTSLTDAALNTYANDYFNDWRIEITVGTGIGQTRDVEDFVQSGGVITVKGNGWTTVPDATTTYELSRMHTLIDVYYAANPAANPDPGPVPSAGGTWLRVPGNSSLGTTDFYVMKYEAKSVTVATSQAALNPWVSITQTAAKTTCEALGTGYHLCTAAEAQTINWNIENTASNWTTGVVGTAGLWRGHTDNAPAASLVADVTGDADDDPYVGTGQESPSIEKRTFTLSNGNVIWDWSGNVWEWLDLTCTSGTGANYWDGTAAWQEWSVTALSDYEKPTLGPEGAYTATENCGRYYGCTANGSAAIRGGDWSHVAYAGVFALYLGNAPSRSAPHIGFRCCK